MMNIKMKKKDFEEIKKECEKNKDKESCGILAGRNNIVEKIYIMNNVSDKPEICYFMDTKEQIKVMKEIREKELDLIGIFHSHINVKAYPSKRDIELAFYPEAVYIIIEIEEGKFQEMNGYEIKNDEIKEVNIEII
ncbi:MAG TPA: M67 family metallopeptidase [bacterium]|nr:M67 family metallopeptidase [bacterium]HPQ18867.1 M67 family metallopeptidase [bacterium]